MKTTEEIHDLIQTAPIEPTAAAINRLLVICDYLNQGLAQMEKNQNKIASDVSCLANGIHPD